MSLEVLEVWALLLDLFLSVVSVLNWALWVPFLSVCFLLATNLCKQKVQLTTDLIKSKPDSFINSYLNCKIPAIHISSIYPSYIDQIQNNFMHLNEISTFDQCFIHSRKSNCWRFSVGMITFISFPSKKKKRKKRNRIKGKKKHFDSLIFLPLQYYLYFWFYKGRRKIGKT